MTKRTTSPTAVRTHIAPTTRVDVRTARDGKTVFVTFGGVELYGDPDELARWILASAVTIREHVYSSAGTP